MRDPVWDGLWRSLRKCSATKRGNHHHDGDVSCQSFKDVFDFPCLEMLPVKCLTLLYDEMTLDRLKCNNDSSDMSCPSGGIRSSCCSSGRLLWQSSGCPAWQVIIIIVIIMVIIIITVIVIIIIILIIVIIVRPHKNRGGSLPWSSSRTSIFHQRSNLLFRAAKCQNCQFSPFLYTDISVTFSICCFAQDTRY